MHDLTKAFKALSDETRLRILCVLFERECCVCEVMQALEISQTRASRNLGILHDAGFLQMRKDGLWSFYSIHPEKNYLSTLAEMARKSLEGSQVAVQDQERLRKAERVGPVCAGKLAK